MIFFSLFEVVAEFLSLTFLVTNNFFKSTIGRIENYFEGLATVNE